MRPVLARVDARREALAERPLFRSLADDSLDGAARLSFAPAMLTYVMCFKDVLATLQVEEPTTTRDRQINAYCIEDANHWRWYLSDLEKLGYGLDSWGRTIPEFCKTVWSAETAVNRRTINSLLYYASTAQDSLVKLVLIQVFEATGVVFIGHTRRAAIAMDADDHLQYFGRLHYEEEFGHTVQADHLVNEHMSAESRESSLRAVDELFDSFDEMFDCWHAHTGRFPVLKPSRRSRRVS
jgi:hypothetical protein